jgi:DNA modification methylase
MLELNKIYNMDCIDGMKLIDDNSVDLVITDCPYKIISGGCSNRAVTINACGGMLNKHNGDNIELIKQGKIFKHNDILFDEWLPIIYKKLKDSSHCYIMINGRNLKNLQQSAEDVGFIFQNLLILIENSSNVGDLILDPFSGSGSTMTACDITKRNFIGFEIDKEHFDKSIVSIETEKSQLKLNI